MTSTPVSLQRIKQCSQRLWWALAFYVPMLLRCNILEVCVLLWPQDVSQRGSFEFDKGQLAISFSEHALLCAHLISTSFLILISPNGSFKDHHSPDSFQHSGCLACFVVGGYVLNIQFAHIACHMYQRQFNSNLLDLSYHAVKVNIKFAARFCSETRRNYPFAGLEAAVFPD